MLLWYLSLTAAIPGNQRVNRQEVRRDRRTRCGLILVFIAANWYTATIV